MTNALKVVQAGTDPLSSDVAQYANAFSGNADVGMMTLSSAQSNPSAPSVAASGTSGNLNGNYLWKIVLITGWKQSDGSYYVSGFAPSAESTSATVTNNSASITSIATGGTNTIARGIYRTTASGASGSEKYAGIIWDNTTTTFNDNVSDASLGTGMPTSSSNPAAYGNAIPANVPTSNTTGTSVTNLGSANNDSVKIPNLIINNDTRSVNLTYEVATTNYVENSDAETVTGTATVFSDAMTAGTTADPAWTTQNGSFTWSTSGATSGGSASVTAAGNNSWKPLTGSNGSVLSLTAQATFTTPSTVSNPSNTGILCLIQNSNSNKYFAYLANGNTFVLAKTINGTDTSMASVSQTITASTAYTITLSITPSGGLTAKLYSGVGTGGTLLQPLNFTDNSLTGGFLIGVGGDTGVVIKNASVQAPFADGWTIAGDTRVAWALTATNPISGTYSMSAVGVGVQGQLQSSSINVSSSTSYTYSGFMNTTNVGSGGANIQCYNGASYPSTTTVIGTTSTTRYSNTFTSGSTQTSTNIFLVVVGMGTTIFDAIQLEKQSSASTYLRNDSTTGSASRSSNNGILKQVTEVDPITSTTLRTTNLTYDARVNLWTVSEATTSKDGSTTTVTTTLNYTNGLLSSVSKAVA